MHTMKPKILINPPASVESDEKSLNLFKNFKVPNLEKIIISSQSLFSDLLNFAGEVWKKPQLSNGPPESLSNSSSVIYEEPSSEILIINRLSTHGSEIKPKRVKNSQSFAPFINQISQLKADEDVQPEVASVCHQSVIEKEKYLRSDLHYGNFLRARKFSIDSSRISIPGKENISILRFPYDSVLENDDESVKSKENSSAENPNLKILDIEEEKEHSSIIEDEKSSLKGLHIKSLSTNFFGIPKIFQVRHNSACLLDKDWKCALETSPDLPNGFHEPEILIENSKDASISKSNSSENSLTPLYKLIPKSILYQIPILTFEEFISSLISQEQKSCNRHIWKGGFIANILCRCCSPKLSREDTEICVKLIGFSMVPFNFQNSLHLILLLSCFKSITKADRWPHADEDWFEMGFDTTDIKSELESNGTISLLHIFFLSTYFPSFYSDLLRVRRYYSFNLYEIIGSISNATIDVLREQKLNKLINNYGRGLEVFFFYYAGVMLYWFKKLIKCKEYVMIFDSTVEKAHSDMEELLEEAWKLYLEKSATNV